MDQNISVWMIDLRYGGSHLVGGRFVADVAVNSAFEIYRQSHLNPGEFRLDALGFSLVIVDGYYHLYRKSLPSTTQSTGSRGLHPSANNF